MVWPMQTLNKMSLEVRRGISCSPDSVIELDLQALGSLWPRTLHCGEKNREQGEEIDDMNGVIE